MQRRGSTSPSLLLHVWLLAQVTVRWITARLPDNPFSADEFGFCSAVASTDGISSTHAARLTGMPATTVISMAGRLERRGLLTATADPDDRRARLWRLTDDGQAHLTVATEQFCAAYTDLVERYPTSTMDAAHAALTELDAMLRHDLGLPTQPSALASSPDDPLTADELAELRTYEAWIRHRRTRNAQ